MSVQRYKAAEKRFREAFEQTWNAAMLAVALRVRHVLSQHPHLDHFRMAMGTYCFWTVDGRQAEYKYLQPFDNFMGELCDMLNVQGEPLLITQKDLDKPALEL